MAKSSPPMMCPGITIVVALMAVVFVDLNPLNVTFGNPVDYNGLEFTEQVINRQKITEWPVQKVQSYDDVKVTHQLEVFELPDEYMKTICPSLDEVNANMKGKKVTVNHYYDVYGANLIGCKNMDVEEIVYPGKMPANMSMSFFSDLIRPDNLPEPVKSKAVKAVSGFVSYYAHPYLSAPMHAAAVDSIVILCEGEKTWGFTRPSANKRWGLLSFFGGVISRGIDEDSQMIIVRQKPNQIVTFPAFWAHWVLTKPGPSFMYTLRVPRLLKAFYRHRLSMYRTVAEIFWENIFSNGAKGSSALDKAVKADDQNVIYDKKEKGCDNEIPLDSLERLMKTVKVDYPLNLR